MAILATLPNPNLFSTLPTAPPHSNTPTPSPLPKPPIPKYTPPLKSRRNPKPPPSNPPNSPAIKTHHDTSKHHKPVKPGQKIPLPDGENRAVVVGNSGISYQLPRAPFEFMHSYSETPKAQPLAMREPIFLPFAPPTMPRPWTGKAPVKKSRRNIKLFEPLGVVDDRSDEDDSIGGKRYEMLRDYDLGNFSVRPREEVLGEPLMRWEIKEMLEPYLSSNRQVNLGRDGVTHNMLELIHTHWRRRPVCKVRCLGVPTVDMDNICRCLEEKSGGKVIHRVCGVLYLFRGRNYDHRRRPKLPVMLWKPATPVYPKLIEDVPEGLTKEEADELRMKGKSLLPICKLAKNGVYVSLAGDVRNAFEGSVLVKIDCRGVHASDYKKLGAKLKELVPCVLLSFDDEQILMWRGRDWKTMYDNETPTINLSPCDGSRVSNISGLFDGTRWPVMTIDTTVPDYWLNWRFLLCALWILVAMVFAAIIIWKYEGHNKSKNGRATRCLYKCQTWRTCLESTHPVWLLVYRVIAFCALLALILADTIVHSVGIFYFYTEWTFTMVTVYFGLGSTLSIYGCLRYCNKLDIESGHSEDNVDRSLNHDDADVNCRTASVWEYALQVIFQMCAGAVALTDAVFWLIIYPFLTDKDYRLNFLVVCMHSVNAVFLLGETFLNCLQFPFFRIAYFVLWTCMFVIVQWIIHACVSTRWPYSFLDLASPYAPIWYLAVGLLHLPCFGIFILIFKIKRCCLSKVASQ